MIFTFRKFPLLMYPLLTGSCRITQACLSGLERNLTLTFTNHFSSQYALAFTCLCRIQYSHFFGGKTVANLSKSWIFHKVSKFWNKLVYQYEAIVFNFNSFVLIFPLAIGSKKASSFESYPVFLREIWEFYVDLIAFVESDKLVSKSL